MARAPLQPPLPPNTVRSVSYGADEAAATVREGREAFGRGERAVANPYLTDMRNNTIRMSVAWLSGWTDAMFDHVRTKAPGLWTPVSDGPTFEEVFGERVNPGARTGRAIDLG